MQFLASNYSHRSVPARSISQVLREREIDSRVDCVVCTRGTATAANCWQHVATHCSHCMCAEISAVMSSWQPAQFDFETAVIFASGSFSIFREQATDGCSIIRLQA
jgi:NADPH:quinone reductase-like Zn-dependent oxidoreductase